MLPKKNRLQLRHHKQFFSNAAKKHTRHFVVFIENASSVTKAAVIVPAKKVPLAVDRAKHKRLIRSALLSILKNRQQSKELNIVVYCKHRLEKIPLQEIIVELSKVL